MLLAPEVLRQFFDFMPVLFVGGIGYGNRSASGLYRRTDSISGIFQNYGVGRSCMTKGACFLIDGRTVFPSPSIELV